MKKMLIAAVLPIAGCGAALSETETRLLDASRTFAVTQIIAFNAAGVDPVNLSEQERVYASLGCGLLASGAHLVSPGSGVAEEIIEWCAVFNQIAE